MSHRKQVNGGVRGALETPAGRQQVGLAGTAGDHSVAVDALSPFTAQVTLRDRPAFIETSAVLVTVRGHIEQYYARKTDKRWSTGHHTVSVGSKAYRASGSE